MSTAGIVDLELDQGADFGIQIFWTDGGNNPFTVLSPMRMDIKSDLGQIIHTLETDDNAADDVLVPILYNSDSGLVQLNIDAASTALFPEGNYAYDLFVTYQDNIITKATRLRRLIAGRITVNGRVTQSV